MDFDMKKLFSFGLLILTFNSFAGEAGPIEVNSEIQIQSSTAFYRAGNIFCNDITRHEGVSIPRRKEGVQELVINGNEILVPKKYEGPDSHCNFKLQSLSISGTANNKSVYIHVKHDRFAGNSATTKCSEYSSTSSFYSCSHNVDLNTNYPSHVALNLKSSKKKKINFKFND